MNKIVATALQYQGVPYVWGGASPSDGGFDCSGLVQYAYSQNNIDIPRTAQEQYNQSTKIDKSQLQLGDLIFTGSSSDNITHVVMYMGMSDNGKEYVIEAPRPGKTVTSRSLESVENIVGYGTYNAETLTNTDNEKWYNKLGVPSTDTILSNVVKFITILLLCVLAVFFFMNAFEINVF